MGKTKMVLHSFYCIWCGNKVMELPRKAGRERPRHHRKKLYCPHCRTEINCVECHDDWDIAIFKEDFEAGLYKQEVMESLDHVSQQENN